MIADGGRRNTMRLLERVLAPAGTDRHVCAAAGTRVALELQIDNATAAVADGEPELRAWATLSGVVIEVQQSQSDVEMNCHAHPYPRGLG
jgi:hypothetical protein